MIEIAVVELIHGSNWTPKQLEAVAALHGKQLAAKTAGSRAFARTLASDSDVVRTAWQLVARG